MNKAHDSVRKKVSAILSELTGDRASQLGGPVPPPKIRDLLIAALREDYPPQIADEMAFHLLDWNSDAAFMVAAHLFPERFTEEEISAGVSMLLAHVPAHVMAAARLGGYSPADDFKDGTEKMEGS